MNLRTHVIGLLMVLAVIMTACNLPADANNDDIALTSIADAGSPLSEVEATAEVTIEATDELDTTDAGKSDDSSTTDEPSQDTITNTAVIVNTSDPSNTGNNTNTNTTCTPRTDWQTYIVRSGDTLGQIAGQVGSSISDLSTANCLDNANVLYVGQQLYVPRQPTSTATSNSGSVLSSDDNSITTDNNCRIIITTQTPVLELPTGVPSKTLGYLETGTVIEPLFKFKDSTYYAIPYQGGTAVIDRIPTGDCHHLTERVTLDDIASDICRIYVNTRTEVVDMPQGTSATILGYLPAGSIVKPSVQIRELSTYGFNYNGQTGWINIKPTGDCSQVPDLYEQPTDDPDIPSTWECFFKSQHSLQSYALPDATSTVVHVLEAGVTYEVTGKSLQSWYKVKFPDVGMEGWVQVEVSGNCSNVSQQIYDCQLVGDTRVPIYVNPEIGSNQLDTLEAGDVYQFAQFDGEWTSGDVSGHWIKIVYQHHRPIAGYVQNTGGHLEGNCPTQS